MLIVKFGGTSLAGAERIRAAARIVAAHRREQPVVCVASAMAGVTDRLIQISDLARRNDGAWHALLEETWLRHQHTLAELTANASSALEQAARLAAVWTALQADLDAMIELPAALHRARHHAGSAFSAWGERLSILLVTAALAAENIAAVPFEEAPVMLVEHDASQQLVASVEATREWLAPQVQAVLHAGSIVVMPGYLARTRQGMLTTLGRNSSDYSAALIGAALHASAVYLYSDVAGIYSADPCIVPEAELLPALTYDEAALIASGGAKVLHPGTIRPLASQRIPLQLRSALYPDAPGTTIGSPNEFGARGVPPPSPCGAGNSVPTGLDGARRRP